MTDPTEGSPVLDSVSVRRSPRVFRFLVVGVAVGVIAALILTLAFPANAQYSLSQVFGFLLLLCVTAGVAVAGGVALLVERLSLRRARTVSAERIVAAGNSSAPVEPPVPAEPPEPEQPPAPAQTPAP